MSQPSDAIAKLPTLRRSTTIKRGSGNGTRYWFRIAARNTAGLGAWCRSVTAVPHN
jgi:hypothetical protein